MNLSYHRPPDQSSWLPNQCAIRISNAAYQQVSGNWRRIHSAPQILLSGRQRHLFGRWRLYCVHRYFFSRDSVYFSTRFNQLDTRDHEALPTIISLDDIERKDFDAFLSIFYPENYQETDLSYEEWESVLRLSTHWDFTSLRSWR
ncbi:hypothetical protein BC826DRAFT_288243 [Russula brevipes]|nr:hypothetical protein BC826DRAFT_288243 [Russula brevipes]